MASGLPGRAGHTEDELSPHQLVAAAAAAVRETSLEAKIRFKAKLFNQELNGTGAYLQMRGRPETFFQMDLKLDVGEQSFSINQMCDGRYLWTRRDLPGGRRLSRIDLRRIAELSTESATDSSSTAEVPSAMPLVAGGLSKMLDGLAAHFDFQESRDRELSKVPVTEVRGVWSRTPEENWTGAANLGLLNAGRAPQLPSRVSIILGRDNYIPLFPYRIEYYKDRPVPAGTESTSNENASADDSNTKADTTAKAGQGQAGNGPGGAGQRRSDLVMAIDFYEVRRRTDLDRRQFVFRPGDQEIEDQTDAYLKKRPRPTER